MPQPVPLRPPKGGIPSHLASREAELYGRVVRSFGLHNDEVALRILEEACCSLQRARECREAIAKDGMTARGSHGQLKVNPLVAAERDARAAGLAALKQLGLDTVKIGKKAAVEW
jgi:P27 family predicted phage terminase small subunit